MRFFETQFFKKGKQGMTVSHISAFSLSQQLQTTMKVNLQVLRSAVVWLLLLMSTIGYAQCPVINEIISTDPTSCSVFDGTITINATADLPMEYSVNGGITFQSSNVFTNLGPTTYAIVVQVNDPACDPATDQVILNNIAAPEIVDIVTNDPAGCDIQNGVIVISATGGQGVYDFSIDGGQNWQSFNTFQNLSSGAYDIAIRNSDGTCFVDGGLSTLSGSSDEPQITDVFVNDVTECDATDGSLTVIVANASPDFEYSNDNGVTWQASNVFDNLAASFYAVSARRTDQTCTVTAGNIEVGSPLQPVILEVNTLDPSGCNTTDGGIVINADPGPGVVQFSIDGGTTFMAFNAFFNLAPGTYQPAIQNLNGTCLTLSDPVTLNEFTLPTFTNLTVNNPTDCTVTNGQIIAEAIPCGNNTIEYSIDGGTTWQSTGTFGGLAGGIYEVVARNVGETTTVSTGNVDLTTPLPPTINMVTTTNPDCQGSGGSVIFTATGNAGFLEYSLDGITWQFNGQFFNLPGGTYIPQVRIPDSSCETVGSPVTLMQAAGLPVDDVVAQNPTCNEANGTINFLVNSPFTLEYSIDGGATWNVFNFFQSLADGTYTPAVRIINGGCETVLDPVTLVENESPDILDVTINTTTTCGGNDGSIIITVDGGVDPVQYSIDGGNTFQSSNTFNNLTEGEYSVVVANEDGTCPSDADQNPILITGPSAGPTIGNIVANPPSICGATDAFIVITASGGPNIEYSIDGGVTFSPDNSFGGLPAGLYDIVVQFQNGCQSTETVDLGANTFCTDQINVVIPEATTTEICLDSVLQINGAITSTSFCNQGSPATVFAPIINGTCVNLAAQIGFSGLAPDTICTIHCYDNDPNLCDTTLIVVFVDDGMGDCEDLFTISEIEQDYAGNPTNVCIPLPLIQAVELDFIVNGNGYSNPLFGCDQDSVVAYNYSLLTGGGLNGPYNLNSWTVGGQMFNSSFTDVTQLVDQMNMFDPQGNWILDLNEMLLLSFNTNQVYGNMDITHTPSSNPTVLQTTTTQIANGTVIQFPNQGENTLIIVDPDTGCEDTLIVTLNAPPVNSDTLFITTIQNTTTGDICATGDDIPGGAQTVGVSLLPQNGGAIVSNDICVTYSPNQDFIGKDTFSLLACNNIGQTLCDTTFVVVCVEPPAGVVEITVDNTLPIDTCITDFIQLPGGFVSAEICDVNADELDVTLNGDCLNIDPNDDLFGTSEICVVHCNADDICDTTTVIVNVFPPCPDYIISSFESIFSDDDSVAVCVIADFDTLSGLDIAIDDVPYTNPLEMCADDDGNEGVLVFVPGGAGSKTITVTDPVTGCTDNLFVIVQTTPVLMLDTLFFTTPMDSLLNDVCGDVSTLPGNPGSIGFCDLPENGTAPLASDVCVDYLPFPGFAGVDDFCLIICDDQIPANCDSTIMIISVLPPVDTLILDLPTIGAFDTCLTNEFLQIEGEIVSTEFCDPLSGDAIISLADSCLTVDVNDDFTGTTNACVVHCYEDGIIICDTTILVITNNNPPCPTIFDTDATTITDDGNGNAAFCINIPFAEFGDYEILVNGAPYASPVNGCDEDDGVFEGTEIVLTGNTSYILMVENTANGCSDTIEISVLDQNSTIEIVTTENITSDTICLDTTMLVGLFDTIIICEEAINGVLDVIDECIAFQPTAGFVGIDEAIIKFCDDLDNCDTINVLITVEPLCQDFDFLENDTVNLEITDCFSNATLCVGIPPSEFLGNFNVLDNGLPYSGGGFLACDTDTCLQYNYVNIPGMGDEGPYTLLSWTIDDDTFSGEFETIQDLVDSMNVWDSAVQWTLNEAALEIEGCGVTNSYGDLQIEQNDTGATATADGVFDFVIQGTQLGLGNGFHNLTFIDINTGCVDSLLVNVTCDVDSTSCGNELLAGSTQLLSDCDSTAQFCFDIPVTDLTNFAVTVNGEPFTDQFTVCADSPINIALDFPIGDYEVVLEDTLKDCMDTFNLSVNCLILDDIIIDTTLLIDGEVDICLENLGFVLTQVDSIVNVCQDQSTGNVDFAYNETTGCIELLGEVLGVDTACYKLFTLDTCVNIFINTKVLETCDAGLLSEDFYGLGVSSCDVFQAGLCLPIEPQEFENVIFTVGGVPYSGLVDVCDEESVFSYPYSSFLVNGLAPPYLIDSLFINDVLFTGSFNTPQDFTDSLNTWNPGCGWMIVDENGDISIQGGCMDDVYGSIGISHGIGGNVALLNGPDILLVPRGIEITLGVGAGTQELVFTDTLTGCTDTIFTTIECVETDTVFLDIEIGTTDTFCLDTTDLVGNLVSISNACPEASGEFVLIETIDAPCFIYTGTEMGTETGCMVLCDDLGVCDTTFVVINSLFDGGPPIANPDLVLGGQNTVISINAICANDVNFEFINPPVILEQPINGMVELVIDSSGTCLYSFNYVPAEDFCDDEPEVFVYEICNAAGCDTAIVEIIVQCDGITVFNGFSPNEDGINEHFEIRGLNNVDFPGHVVRIFSRWGTLVYETEQYENNPWMGQYQDDLVPDGTYFYVIDLGNDENLKGYVQVHR